jgi:hypothetical protein
MTGPLRNLDAPCPACGRASGDHTLREWSVCLGTTTTDLPFEKTAPDMARAAADAVREQFQLDGDLIIADHIVAKAMTLAGSSGLVAVRLPALLHEFQVGVAGQPPSTVAKVIYLGDAPTMRKYGRLVRDTANGAANAAERAA